MDSRKFMLFVAAVLLAGTGIAGAKPEPTTNRTINGVILDSGNPGTTLAKGYNTLDQTTLSCNSFGGCTLGMRMMSNVGDATCKSQWAIDALVDGMNVDGGPLLDTLPGAGNTQSRIWQGTHGVAYGSHTITFQIYLPCSANANQWSVRYLIASP